MAVRIISIIALSIALVLDIGLEIIMVKEIIGNDVSNHRGGYITGSLVGIANMACVLSVLLEAI